MDLLHSIIAALLFMNLFATLLVGTLVAISTLPESIKQHNSLSITNLSEAAKVFLAAAKLILAPNIAFFTSLPWLTSFQQPSFFVTATI